MNDIVERLRTFLGNGIGNDAAKEIENLRQQVKEMQHAQAGFMHLSDMRQAMIDTADENVHLRQQVNLMEEWKMLSQQYSKELATLKESQGEPFGYVDPDTLKLKLTADEHRLGATVWPVFLSTSAQTIPEGWQIVPIEVTDKMAQAFNGGSIGGSVMSMNAYHAMLAAAPKLEDMK